MITPTDGWSISFQMIAAITGAIISGRMRIFSSTRPTIDDRCSSRATATPRTVSKAAAPTAYSTVTQAEFQKASCVNTVR